MYVKYISKKKWGFEYRLYFCRLYFFLLLIKVNSIMLEDGQSKKKVAAKQSNVEFREALLLFDRILK